VVGRRALFLDRDGVINRSIVREGKPYPPQTAEALEVLPGVPDALQRARAAGYLNIVVTNQPDVATGKQTLAEVERMHAFLRANMPIDAIKACFHVDADACSCRKPAPGMLLEAAGEFGVDLALSALVGDRWRDIGAAHAAGVAGYFIDYGYRERRPEPPYTAVKSLPDAVAHLLAAR